MEDAGLVRREGTAEDGRAAHLFATADGLAKAAAARPILARLRSKAIPPLLNLPQWITGLAFCEADVGEHTVIKTRNQVSVSPMPPPRLAAA
jgi:hypothetical protein